MQRVKDEDVQAGERFLKKEDKRGKKKGNIEVTNRCKKAGRREEMRADWES